VKVVSFGSEFVPPNVALVKDRPVHSAFAQKVASCKVGSAEVKVQGMPPGDSIKGIKLRKLEKGHAGPQERAGIEILAPQVDVDTPDDPFKELFQFVHGGRTP
jgi:hypothetical protein